MKTFLWALALLVAAAFAPAGAQAQTLVKTTCAPTNPFVAGQTGRPISIDENGNTCITGSISASLTGFTPGLTFASLTASAASGSVALPAGTTVAFQNTGTTTVSCTMGVGSATAVAGQIQVPASSTVFVTPGSNTWGACINESGVASNVVRLAGGSGLGTGFGGGGGGGGGGAVTIADGASVALGAQADAAAAGDTSTATLIALMKRNNQNLTTLNTTASSPASLAINVTPTNCGGTVTTGGTAQNAFTAGATKHGFTIANIDTTEVLWISFTTTALAADTQSYPLAPATATTFAGLSSYTTPPGFGMNTALSVVAATTGHKFTCTWW